LAYDGLVTKQSFDYPGTFSTVGGATIKQVKVGYETLGKLDAAGTNAILIPHFFSGNSHFAGRYKADDRASGYWDGLVCSSCGRGDHARRCADRPADAPAPGGGKIFHRKGH